jgi:fatty-acyl-CoA synthase
MGAVLHTLNIRLFSEQLEYIVNHAEDRVVLVDASLAPAFAELLPRLPTVEHVIVLGDGDASALPDAIALEDLLGAHEPGFPWPRLDDRMAAGLCYTSGTTGNPKGVLYSHRSNVLHALAQCLAISMGLRTDDRVLPVVPMFHANAWGLPYSSALVGADLVMPGPYLQAEPLADLIASERVTVAGAVPTIWMDLLRFADEHRPDLSSLRIVACGGSAVPLALMRDFEERHGVPIVQAWGMTETSPLGSIAFPPPGAEGEDHWRHRATAGRPLPLVEARVVGADGEEQPWDGSATGELEVRGPWICAEYYRDPAGEEKFDDGWLRTGDVASIDPKGYIRISDRAKDVIKSGGEWISSVDLEVELMAHPAVAEAAVIAKPDERWSERPLACVVVPEGTEAPSAEELAAHLRERVAKWWIPDEFAFIDEVPKTSVGKFDKKVLRRALEEGRLEDRRVRVEAPRSAAAPG